MSRFVRLAEVVVTHDYFAAPAQCRCDFLPDTATADWLRRTGSVVRAQDNRLLIYGDAATVAAAPATTLTFAARPCDADFDRYTASAAAAGDGAAPLLVFDTRLAVGAHADGSFDLDAACPMVADASHPAGLAGFVVTVTVGGDTVPGAVFNVALHSRTLPWKYLLSGDWAADDPVVVVPPPDDGQSFTRDVDMPLANGEQAMVLRSGSPIGLGDRRRRELWSQAGGARGQRLIRTLPLPEPANIVREDPTDPASLVCEIYVSR